MRLASKLGIPQGDGELGEVIIKGKNGIYRSIVGICSYLFDSKTMLQEHVGDFLSQIGAVP